MGAYEFLGHVAFALIACSFLFTSILWLRIVSVIASICAILFNYYGLENIGWIPIIWNAVFICLNMYHITKIAIATGRTRLTDKEQSVFDKVFKNKMSPANFRYLLSAARMKKQKEGDLLTTQGKIVESLIIIVSGSAEVVIEDNVVAKLEKGDFVGEMSFLTGKPATATVRLAEDTEYIVWNQKSLKKLVGQNPPLHFGLQAVASTQITDKLVQQSIKVRMTKNLLKPEQVTT